MYAKILDIICSSAQASSESHEPTIGASDRVERIAEIDRRIGQIEEQIRLIRINCDSIYFGPQMPPPGSRQPVPPHVASRLMQCNRDLGDKNAELDQLRQELAEIGE